VKVYIAYGWLEGTWQGKKLRSHLVDAGHTVTSSMQEADVIIAHSAGCYMLTTTANTKLTLLIGLPNWPRTLIKCTFEKVRIEHKDCYWFKKTFWNLIYAIFQPVRLVSVYRSFNKKTLPNFKNCEVILIHNKLDTYMDEGVSTDLAKQHNWQYKNVSGEHDDLWQNTDFYINFIKQYIS